MLKIFARDLSLQMNLYLLCNYSLLAVLNEIYGIVSALPLEKGFGLLAPKPPTCYTPFLNKIWNF